MTTPGDILAFWTAAGPEKWFAKDDAFDAFIQSDYLAPHFAASRGEYVAWEETAEGALALLILLDQFPRNLFRSSGHAFATDGLARAVARRALDRGFGEIVDQSLAIFFYLPFEHSEDPADQELSVSLFTQHFELTNDQLVMNYALEHRDIIAHFGRFPHRNAALGRETTPEEQAYLNDGGFKG
ncbi:DUF924 domain-containing protein [Rhizobium sp. S95]|uniref:DUF924 domain-containing protein n=1 Tax=Ciceribacter sichuanensis TaxID=2949647 RepID=A0AAJ1C1G6_9HYPH|nr:MULTISPECIES: DUF924 family protein [unclassified Ciceribacter]MCM2397774.1 DUF924 domain-containing protein [Ciceribacter sp. S95]MCO5960069.1 DUF924 domain-containing protein [Ciceribacter sp. S101]